MGFIGAVRYEGGIGAACLIIGIILLMFERATEKTKAERQANFLAERESWNPAVLAVLNLFRHCYAKAILYIVYVSDEPHPTHEWRPGLAAPLFATTPTLLVALFMLPTAVFYGLGGANKEYIPKITGISGR